MYVRHERLILIAGPAFVSPDAPEPSDPGRRVCDNIAAGIAPITERPNTVSGLIDKRRELAGRIEHAQRERQAQIADFDISIQRSGYSIRCRYRACEALSNRIHAFKGEMARHVMDALRTAKGKPITSSEIAARSWKGGGLKMNLEPPSRYESVLGGSHEASREERDPRGSAACRVQRTGTNPIGLRFRNTSRFVDLKRKRRWGVPSWSLGSTTMNRRQKTALGMIARRVSTGRMINVLRHKRVEPLNNRLDRKVRTAWRIEQGLDAPTDITPDDMNAIRRALSCYR
jgi:hypothetical protein